MEITRQQQKELRQQGKKCCPKCNEIKLLEEFSTSGLTPNGLVKYGMCKICERGRSRIKKKIYYENNKEKCLTYAKEWKDKNPELRKKQKKRYNEKNRDTINAYKRKRRRRLYNESSEYRFICSIERHLRGVKNRKEFKDLWDDVREVYDFYDIPYHIDHMVPKNWFKVGSPKYIINHIKNLQVIDAEYNLSKQDRWSDPVPSDYLDKIRPYIKKEYLGLLKSL